MNKAQKIAWFNLVITAVLVILHASAFGIIALTGTLPRIVNSAGFFVVCGLIAVSALVFRRKQHSREVDFDERDKAIGKRALVISYFLLWGLLVAGCAICPAVIGLDGAIPAYLLPLAVYTIFIVTMFTHSLTILVQYGKERKL